MTVTAPRWDLTNVYPSLESRQFKDAMKEYNRLLDVLEKFHRNTLSKAGEKTSARELGSLLGRAVDQFNAVFELSNTLHAYIDSFVTTDSHDKTAARLLSQFEQAQVRQSSLYTRFTAWVGALGAKLDPAVEKHPSAKSHAFALKEARDQAKYLMSEAEGAAI